MASSRSGSLALAKPPAIHQKLLEGEKFIKWTEKDNNAVPVTMMVEKNGFFLYYYDQKDKEVTLIDLSQIRDVRTSSQARIPKDQKLRGVVSLGAGALEDKTITVVHGTDFVNVNFVNFCTNKVEAAELWAKELWRIIRNVNPLNFAADTNLRKIHAQLCLISNGDKPIPAKSIVKFFAQSREDRKVVERALDQSGLPSGKTDEISKSKFGFEEFQVFYKTLLQRSEVSQIFSKLFIEESKQKIMTSLEFLNFLNNYQRDPRLNEILHPYATEEKALALIRQYEPNALLVPKNHLSEEGFMWFLLSEDNLVMSPESLLKIDNMDAPMSHYFIKSSHNTYLTGHQLTGRASVEMYRQVLLSGCRCIELDFWNGEEEPHITHGYTMVNKLPAREVLQAIAEVAFKTSEYPLILSFENHCNPKQQAKIAEYCKEYFGDMLLHDPLDSHPLEPDTLLPPPELLKGKILIKNKRQHTHNQNHTVAQPTRKPSSPSHVPPKPSASTTPCNSPLHQTRHPRPDLPELPLDLPVVRPTNGDVPELGAAFSPSDSSDDSDSEEEDTMDSTEQQKVVVTSIAGTAGKESKACAAISALVNYVMPVHWKSFTHADKRRRAYEMSSFVETLALSLLKEDPIEFVKYNRFQASRIYPRGTRTDSSNFLPQIYWNAGCQLVALNYQTLDVPMQLNLGIFQYNKRTGYLLKPDFMCREDRKFDPFTESSVDGIVSGTVSVRILSGQFLTVGRAGTYVEVEMYGLPRDTVRRGKFRTKTVQNGISPVFDEEPFLFRQVILPDLAVLRIAAFEEGNKLIGHRVLPITGLCPGYRHIPLFNEVGQPLSLPCVFVHITVGDYVPNSLTDLAEALANPIKYQTESEQRAAQLVVLQQEEDERSDSNCTKPEPGQANPGGDNDDRVSLAGGGSTPECASPSSAKSTWEYLKRTGSTKPGGSKDSSPTMGPQRTASNKSLQNSKDGETQPANCTVANKDLTPESVEKLLEHKSLRDKSTELNSKLEQLRKKKEKELTKLQAAEEKLSRQPSKHKNPLAKKSLNKIVKKFSTASLETTHSVSSQSVPSTCSSEISTKNNGDKKLACERNFLLLEKELKEKYLDGTFSQAEKVMHKSQASQLKSLEILHNQEANEVMKRIEGESKMEDIVPGPSNITREDLQRERRARLVKRGVMERGKLQELYTGRRTELELAQERVRQELKSELELRRTELETQFGQNLAELECWTKS